MGRREQFLKDAVQALKREGIDASCCVGDVRSRESAEAAVAFTVSTYGSLNILVNSKLMCLARFLALVHPVDSTVSDTYTTIFTNSKP
jgi:NAD(P)-dependent dehydrogenase (short-subunit alcohol dehydrogenase family)